MLLKKLTSNIIGHKFYGYVVFITCVCVCNSIKTRHHNAKSASQYLETDPVAYSPNIFNIAQFATITTNATCGMYGREEFCRLIANFNPHKSRSACDICDANSANAAKRHSIEYAIDGTKRWWQSPSLAQGPDNEFVTITLDLKQIFHISNVILKSANSLKPGTWILERSIDGETFVPWQYYVTKDSDCRDKFDVPPTPGNPKYRTTTDVICTSYYSEVSPLENGVIQTTIQQVDDMEVSPAAAEFSKARYVRIRLMGFIGKVWEVSPSTKYFTSGTYSEGPETRFVFKGKKSSEVDLAKSFFYSIRDIIIGGYCFCNGHANQCVQNKETQLFECSCKHNTCGLYCEKCCPMYNGIPYQPSVKESPFNCEPCQCYGHASACVYDVDVDRNKGSLDARGRYHGGGVCLNCTAFTEGHNCQKCQLGYYKPDDRSLLHPEPCIPCDCHPSGSNGDCLQEAILETDTVGDCVCKKGYTGPRCSVCAEGYRGFPNCEPCPCDPLGTVLQSDCEGVCTCKENVEGDVCSSCKAGTYALQYNNPAGCSHCYCSGTNATCESMKIESYTIEEYENWHFTDMTASVRLKPIQDFDTGWLVMVNYEFPETDTYYWLAPNQYTGNRLQLYGSVLTFSVNWDIMRGDTSGKATREPTIIMVGANNLRIAYGYELFNNDDTFNKNATFRVTFAERGWYHFAVPEQTATPSKPVTRFEYLSVLTHVKYLFLRARFHADQFAAALESALFTVDGNDLSLVELCFCPEGYGGLSCEKCDYGYASRSYFNARTQLEQTECLKCDCNNHSATCDLQTGRCHCEHNTIGEKCQRCALGYYGNPLFGNKWDCKKCGCPRAEPENNFSPSCQLDVALDGSVIDQLSYVCTQCPQGYTGNHCEICDDGFFGDPMTLGDFCKACDCNGGPCNHVTGQCLACRGNTEGWRCDKCKSGHFGEPKTGCKPCDCDHVGAASDQCDLDTGQCACKERVTGRDCGQCQLGYGNLTAGCVECSCNLTGSVSEQCHAVSGLCECRVGVEGFKCDTCQHLYFGFSDSGCRGCNCNKQGSEIETCDIVSGQCRCRANVIGRTCDQCKPGYWNLSSSYGCAECQCDELGSFNGSCDIANGQCACRKGVGGVKCDACLPGYYGFSKDGCKECDVCKKSGHVCDPDTGRCVCPPFSYGERCNKCIQNSWGFEPSRGCRLCECSTYGSLRTQCDSFTGQCQCRKEYTGHKCDKCAAGYFGYPQCRKCGCNVAGTLEYTCDSKSGSCECDTNGACSCKANVEGRKCDTCRNGTYGLERSNLDGCTKCFCFGRTTHCTESGLTWSQIRLKIARELVLEPINHTGYEETFVAFIQQTFLKYVDSRVETVTTLLENYGYLNETSGLPMVPETFGNVTIGMSRPYQYPLYWKLPEYFYGDHVVSYGGFLYFDTVLEGATMSFPAPVFDKYPLVIIQGHGIVLGYFPYKKETSEVRFHESLWSVYNDPMQRFTRNQKVTRDLIMLVLQNLQLILIRANDAQTFTKAILRDVKMDTAVVIPGRPLPHAIGVELCDCPLQYNSTSCQNPSIGFYRWYNKEYSTANSTIIIDLVGEAKRCDCNGRSDKCNMNTGHCENCASNTVGPHCEFCAEGFYGTPNIGCESCPCPGPGRNFAKNCYQSWNNEFVCECRNGYAGKMCEACSPGFFWKDDHCEECNCNRYGSKNNECDRLTGLCACKPTFNGPDCSLCQKYRHILHGDVCMPCDNCTQTLTDDFETLTDTINEAMLDLSDGMPPPHSLLTNYTIKIAQCESRLSDWSRAANSIRTLPMKKYKLIKKDVEHYKKLVGKLVDESMFASQLSNQQLDRAELTRKGLEEVGSAVRETIGQLDSYSVNERYLNIPNTIQFALEILGEIKNSDFTEPTDQSESVLAYCTDLLGQIHDINTNIDDFFDRLSAAYDLVMEINNKVNIVIPILALNRLNLQRLTHNLTALSAQYDALNMDYVDGNVRRAEELAAVVRVMFEDIADKNDELKRLVGKLQENFKEVRDLRVVVNNARAHAFNLTRISGVNQRTFNQLKSQAELALSAEKAYENIYNGLEDAQDTADDLTDILDDLYAILRPVNEETLVEKSVISYLNANRSLDGIDALNNRMKSIHEKHLYLEREVIETIKTTLKRAGFHANTIEKALSFNYTITDTMKKIFRQATDESRALNDILSEARRVQNDRAYKLKPLFNELKLTEANISVTLSKASENLTEAQRRMRNLNGSLIELDRFIQKDRELFERWNNTLAGQLDELKEKIFEAQRLSKEIQIPLKSKDNYKCVRVYDPETTALLNATSTHLSFTLALTQNVDNSPLIYLAGSSSDSFVAIEMIARRIRFVWSLKRMEVGVITHPERVELLSENSGFYYYVEVERIRNVGKLLVRKQLFANGTTVKNQNHSATLSKSTSSQHTMLNLGNNGLVWVGGAPNHLDSSLLLKNQGLEVSLNNLQLNEKPIGLWNFVNNTKNSCESDTFWTYTLSEYQLQGTGYSMKEMKSLYASTRISVTLTLKTFDENALIFAAVSSNNNSFISISLRDGHIVYAVQYIGDATLEIVTPNKYNTGQPIRIEGSREFNRKKVENAKLQVNDDVIFGKPTIPITKKQLPDLRVAWYYLGGLPPYFFDKMSSSIVSAITPATSFLGCMSNVQIDGTRFDPVDTDHDGIEYACSQRLFNRVGFFGNGFIKIPVPLSFTETDFETFSFVFVTQQSDALLAYLRVNNSDTYVLVKLNMGRIECTVNVDDDRLVLTTTSTFNDGRYHAFSLNQANVTLELRVDDILEASTSKTIAKLSTDVAYFGGFPHKDDNDVFEDRQFEGTVRDVILNNESVLFNAPLQFENVAIGRTGKLSLTAESLTTVNEEPMKKPTALLNVHEVHCFPGVFERDMNAYKFGDANFSHVQHPLNIANFWHKNFFIELEFSTFYASGVLFVSPGLREKQAHHILLEIRNKKVHLSIKGRHAKETTLPDKVSDGQWHSVIVKMLDKKWTLIVDRTASRSIKVPKKLNVANMIYLGGWSQFGNRLSGKLINDLRPFRGCLRNLKVNGVTSNLSRDIKNNVDNCFRNVENSTYFNGNAFIRTDKTWTNSTTLNITLNFRTNVASSSLIYYKNADDNVLIVVDVGKTSVLIRVNNKEGAFESTLPYEYNLCDYHWHRLQFNYHINDVIQVRVDDADLTSWRTYGVIHERQLGGNKRVYIGGSPGSETNQKSNFIGCIKNVIVDGIPFDWTDNGRIVNVAYMSCPAA